MPVRRKETLLDGRTSPFHHFESECQVVDRQQTVSRQLASHYEMAQVAPAVRLARVTGTLGIDGFA